MERKPPVDSYEQLESQEIGGCGSILVYLCRDKVNVANTGSGRTDEEMTMLQIASDLRGFGVHHREPILSSPGPMLHYTTLLLWSGTAPETGPTNFPDLTIDRVVVPASWTLNDFTKIVKKLVSKNDVLFVYDSVSMGEEKYVLLNGVENLFHLEASEALSAL